MTPARHLAIGCLAAGLLAAVARPAAAQELPQEVLRRGVGPDLQLEAGYTLLRDGDLSSRWLGRARLGVLLVKEPHFIAIGATASLGGVGSPAIGVQVDYTHLWSGVWLAAGGALTIDVDPVVSITAGWSIIGLELQGAFRDEGESTALLLKLRAPLGAILFALTCG